jgi:hypothetical protein
MATSKALRAAPDKILDNYVASIRHLQGAPRSVGDDEFTEADFLTAGSTTVPVDNRTTAYNAGYTNRSIGFGITINGITYKKFAVAEHGWMMLMHPDDPGTSASTYNDVLNGGSLSSNTGIIGSPAVKNQFVLEHVILAPWWDYSVAVPRAADILKSSSEYNSTITSTIYNKIASGQDSSPWPFDPIDRGVRFRNFIDARYGKYLLVRWTNSQLNFGDKLKFEVALFENGRIEFRYWPLQSYQAGDSTASDSSTTVGIFWNAASGSPTNRFRDFAPMLSYQQGNSRIKSELGGAPYDPAYNGGLSYVPYSYGLNRNFWPKNGGIITFAPPQNMAKFLPRSIIKDINSAKNLTSEGGVFDDRKTISYQDTSQQIYMPSTLPSRLLGDSGDVNVTGRQLLFSSNGIKTTGKINFSAIEGPISQLNALEKVSISRSENAFNESKKNYETANLSSFYATGSSSEYSGLGFDAPLKSKTSFSFSLPVTKAVRMPALTSSLYYYSKDKKQWTMKSLGSDPREHYESYLNDTTKLDNDSGYARVFESAIGFDAVGRRVTSGSIVVAGGIFPKPPRSHEVFGIKVNLPKGKSNTLTSTHPSNVLGERRAAIGGISDVPTKILPASMTDNPSLYPSKDQMISFPLSTPFVVEKIVIDIPIQVSGTWFNDRTTCVRPYDRTGASTYYGFNLGSVDFGGPGLTFSLFCARRGENSSYMDIIASGTITHSFDARKKVAIHSNPNGYYSVRPFGYNCFSAPTAVITGTWNGSSYEYTGKVRMELAASQAAGVVFARHDAWQAHPALTTPIPINAAVSEGELTRILETPKYAYTNKIHSNKTSYPQTGSRIYVQQVSPYSRGTTNFEPSGNSLFKPFLNFNVDEPVQNPLYITDDANAKFGGILTTIGASKGWDGVSITSTVNSRPSPYLLMPGDMLGISMSKVRPVVQSCVEAADSTILKIKTFKHYILTGSHHGVSLATGSIEMTVYGSYISQGQGYTP